MSATRPTPKEISSALDHITLVTNRILAGERFGTKAELRGLVIHWASVAAMLNKANEKLVEAKQNVIDTANEVQNLTS